MTNTENSFDPTRFPPVLEALKQSLAGMEEIRQRKLAIDNMVLDPGPMKNNYYPIDVTYKGIIADKNNTPAAFILCANPIGKTLVKDNVEKARSARSLLQSPHDQVIVLPFVHGEVLGVSWAIYDLNTPLTANRWMWQVQKRLLTPMVGKWLTDVVKQTRHPMCATGQSVAVISALQTVCREKKFPKEMIQSAENAMEALSSGAWCPFTSLAHNDLWRGNIMRPPKTGVTACQFRIIDWAGADTRGIPFFDLFKFLQSFTVPRSQGKKMIQAHCDILECRPVDATAYLLTALGVLGQNLNQFPHHAYVNLAKGLYAFSQTH
ncbi:Ecdysteroid kinase [Desulfocicer vacuolatum DSM 3385]|uniref:Ecdysteroid kinase n=1 Tax=Desulfocicer vacuolatum DSM 3385 TaxID=1121400 RepID=A0A1W2DP29_9BACT|nr:hypothetical protein [Desulfocicer vacuolatum]SMC99211.1 Ecdysteroid kinase [Desulfocicer vacuolatum DSM 3385]